MKLYHGTHYENLQSIYSEGLRAAAPTPWETSGVFLTSSFEKAARYGVNMSRKRIPVIVAVELTRGQVSKLLYDPQDRETLWTDDGGYDDDWAYELNWLGDPAKAVAAKVLGLETIPLRWGYSADFDIAYHYSELESLRGVNILDWAAEAVMAALPEGFKVDEGRIKEEVKRAYEKDLDQEYESIEIDSEGNILLTEDWYLSREQLIYPGSIPFSQVSEIWIRPSDHDDLHQEMPLFSGVQTEQFPYLASAQAGISDLPQESRRRLESIEATIGLISRLHMEHSKKDFIWVPDKDDIEEYIEEFREFDPEWQEPILILQDLKRVSPEEDDNDWVADKEYKETLLRVGNEMLDLDYSIYEDWGQTRVSKPEEWVRIL